MLWRLPKKLSFPWGFEVTVAVVEREAIEGGNHGEWDGDAQEIRIARDLTPAEKRGTLLHEWEHAATDWRLWVSQEVPVAAPEGLPPDPTEVEEEES